MALTSTGLTGAGKTTNFLVQYETGLFDSLPAAQKAIVKSNLIANANALLAVIENEFTVTTGWFNTPAGKFDTEEVSRKHAHEAIDRAKRQLPAAWHKPVEAAGLNERARGIPVRYFRQLEELTSLVDGKHPVIGPGWAPPEHDATIPTVRTLGFRKEAGDHSVHSR